MGHLARGMDPGIGSSRSGQQNGFSGNARESGLNRAGKGLLTRLFLPAMIGRAIIR
jgi:hypothetical protein